MSQNLKERLNRYRHTGTKPAIQTKGISIKEDSGFDLSLWEGWTEAGYKTLKRKIIRALSFSIPETFPETLAIILPDIARTGRTPEPEELLFFDLETTGLSGGAGTVAFLAAFGRFIKPDKSYGKKDEGSKKLSDSSPALEITQYLLLDYPGEPEFIELILKEFSPHSVIVSYNGKCFDSQILRNRCLMNGLRPPEYFHADLLHPARRLWKNKLPDCSQATIEVSILGLDRTGDISGAFAPDIWFTFLKSGENRDLLSICEHNAKDITGLAALFLAFGEIAVEPLRSSSRYNFDMEAMAFAWRAALKKNRFLLSEKKSLEFHAETAGLLLKTAAEKGSFRAAITLAIDAEWRIGDIPLALCYTNFALGIPGIPETLKNELEKRLSRLEKKIKKNF